MRQIKVDGRAKMIIPWLLSLDLRETLFLSYQSSSTHLVSPRKLEPPCWSSDIVSTEKLGAIMLSTDDVRSSQERQRERNE